MKRTLSHILILLCMAILFSGCSVIFGDPEPSPIIRDLRPLYRHTPSLNVPLGPSVITTPAPSASSPSEHAEDVFSRQEVQTLGQKQGEKLSGAGEILISIESLKKLTINGMPMRIPFTISDLGTEYSVKRGQDIHTDTKTGKSRLIIAHGESEDEFIVQDYRKNGTDSLIVYYRQYSSLQFELRVDGIGLGSTASELVDRLGQPSEIQESDFDGNGIIDEISYRYYSETPARLNFQINSENKVEGVTYTYYE